MSRRNIELVLLLVAAPVVALLFAMIAINEGQQVNVDSLSVPIGIFAAFVVAHLAVRKLAPGADPALLPLAFGLSGIGIAFILVYGIADYPDNVIRHAQFYLAGLVMAMTLPSAPKDAAA